MILFADDTALFNSHKNQNYLQFSLEHDMHLLIEWLSVNQLSLNMDKPVILRYWPNTRPNSKSFEISVNGVKLQIVEYTKFLCIYVDQELNWKKNTVPQCLINYWQINICLLWCKTYLIVHV